MLSNAAFCAPDRTTLRETESGAHYEAEEGPCSVAPAKLCSGAGRGSPDCGCAVQRSPPRSHVPSSTLRRARRRRRILPQPGGTGLVRVVCFVARLAKGNGHWLRLASRIPSRKAAVATAWDLIRGSLTLQSKGRDEFHNFLKS